MPVPAVLLLGLLSAAGCNRQPAAATAPAAGTSSAAPELAIEPLSPLLPNRATHLAWTAQGNLYWSQESDDGHDRLFVMGSDGVPQATQLSSQSIADALGADSGRGNIQSLCAGPGQEIYFYFHGESAGRALAALGRFAPDSSEIRILCDTAALERSTGMGESIALARGAMAGGGSEIWLRIHHTDAACMFRFDPRAVLPDAPLELHKAFDAIRLENVPAPFTDDQQRIAPDGEGSFLLLDPAHARLLRVDMNGTATSILSLLGLPGALSTPAMDPQGRIVLFDADSTPLAATNPADTRKTWRLDISWPALLMLNSRGTMTAISRDHFQTPPGIAAFGMKITELIAAPAGSAPSFIGYDSHSGQVLRLTVKNPHS